MEVSKGLTGKGRVVASLSSINTTDDMFGLLDAESCTHNIPMCMHLKALIFGLESRIEGSRSSITLSSFHRRHAYAHFITKKN
jgi:hypothetical protein